MLLKNMKKYNHFESIIIIPTFNEWAVLKFCLKSLKNQTYQNFKILVVDDGSTDNIFKKTKEEFPHVEVLTLNKNIGFAKAINKGIKYTLKKYKPKYIALLNNDTEADKNWLKSLVNCLQKDKQIATVTSNMFFAKKPEIINSQGGTIDWNGDGCDINIFKPKSEVEIKSQPVLGACFGGTLLKAESLEKIGLVDERYYAYYEDLDWSWRANILGYKIFFEKQAILYHQHSASWQKGLEKKVYLGKKNALTSAIKNYESKNLFKRILYILIGYWFLILDYAIFSGNFKNKQKQKLPINKRLKFTLIPFKAVSWNIIHLPKTLILRRDIQKRRKISDEEIFKLINQDESPVNRWIDSLHKKISFKHFLNHFQSLTFTFKKKSISNISLKKTFGVNVLGYIDAESGVGEAARTIIKALKTTKIPFALNNETSSPSLRKNNEFSSLFINKNPYLINIICIYGDTFKEVVKQKGQNYLKNKYNIAYWAWELSTFPKNWIEHLSLVDEIWVPSNFVKNTIAKHFKKPIIVVPHAIKVKNSQFNRNYFSFSQNSFIFLFVFDFYSCFERKNPLAIIKAFKKAFNKNKNVELVIKCSNGEIDNENLEKLNQQAKNWPIKIINKYLTREEINGLLGLCNAYISLHRSEGFGLTIAEAMALGKPVIATNYSGNVDFMNKQICFPINYTLKTIEKDYGPYKKGNIWAKPDIEEAVKQMRFIFKNKKKALKKGQQAKEYILKNFSPKEIAKKIEKRLNEIKNLDIRK